MSGRKLVNNFFSFFSLFSFESSVWQIEERVQGFHKKVNMGKIGYMHPHKKVKCCLAILKKRVNGNIV